MEWRVVLYANNGSESRRVEDELKQRGVDYVRIARATPPVRGQDDEEIPSVLCGAEFYRGAWQALLYMPRIEAYAIAARRKAERGGQTP